MSQHPPRVYLAGPLGFTDSGRLYHNSVLRPRLQAEGFDVLDPWPSADEKIGGVLRSRLDGEVLARALEAANYQVGADNDRMIQDCDYVLAVLDGSDVDSGTAAEVGYAMAREKPVVGLRTDLRMTADNMATAVNLQVAYFVQSSGGIIVSTLDEAVAALRAVAGLAPRTEAESSGQGGAVAVPPSGELR